MGVSRDVPAEAAPASPTTPSRGTYWPALDGLRALAIGAVMLYHLNARVARGGASGLTVFFVLSGFLITRLLLQEWDATSRVSFRDFYVRRALRLFPALFAMLGVLLVIALLADVGSKTRNFAEIAVAIGYVTNIAAAYGWVTFHYLGHTWSLATEEQFYLLWPAVLVLMLRRRWTPRAIVTATVALAAASTLLRAGLYRSDANFNRVTFAPDTRASELMIGCATALILHYALLPDSDLFRRVARFAAWVAVPVGLVFARLSGHNVFTFRYVFTVVALCVAVTIVDLQLSPGSWRERILALPPLVWMGRLSYALYLWHVPVFRAIDENYTGPAAVEVAVKLGLAFALAVASYYLIETRFLRLKARYTAERATVAPAV